MAREIAFFSSADLPDFIVTVNKGMKSPDKATTRLREGGY
jgi:hypothetical protein